MPTPQRPTSSWRRKLLGRRRLVLLPLLAVAATIGISSLWAGTAQQLRPVTGTTKNDVLRGSARGDHIRGFAGNDRLYGYRGNDLLVGGPGADVLVGGLGTDRLWGGPGDDRINSRDGVRDWVYCGPGRDTVIRDARDVLARDCETGGPPVPGPPTPPAPRPGHTVELVDQAWQCLGPVDLDLVRVTMRTKVDDAVRLDQNCSGRVGRLEVETWTADGIKIQNRGTVAHDLVIESGYVKCHAIYGGYHQDGLQAMGGLRITLRGVRIDCLGNSNFFLSRGGSGASTPTDIVCEGCVLGPNSGQTLFYAPSIRSGLRNSTICTGRFRAIRVEPGAQAMVNEGNKVLPRNHPSCANVTGRG